MSHTPGPWSLTPLPDSGDAPGECVELYARPIYAPPQPPLLYSSTVAVAVCDDDARLIAAAPDLLAACEALIAARLEDARDGRFRYGLGPGPEMVTVMEAVHAAVKKARGER